jgi:HPt (histidine-containing phosphotransfer) domain-containing protein
VNLDTSCKVQLIEPGTADEEFEKVRQRFRQRLLKEKAQFSALVQALGRAPIALESTFVDIGAFAHRLRGAALVFGFQALGDGAKAVEQAATAASIDVNGRRDMTSLAAAMQALAVNLADEVGTGAPCAAGARSSITS